MGRTEVDLARKQQSGLVPDATFFMEILGGLLILTLATGGMVFALL
jgi:hypothetical protein